MSSGTLRDGRDQYGFAPDPVCPGWLLRTAIPTGRFLDIFGDIRLRVEAADRVRIRVLLGEQHRNIRDHAHGGFLLALIDQAYFMAPVALGIESAMMGMTVDSATQFLAPVEINRPVDVVVEVLRETGRMVFVRGLVEQEDVKALAFSGTIRKASIR